MGHLAPFWRDAELRCAGLNSHFSYQGQGGLSHVVWYLDAVTVHNQARSALSLQPAGVAVWRLGLKTRVCGSIVGRGRVPDSKALDSLRRPLPGNDISSLTKGDVTSSASRRIGEAHNIL